MLSQRVRDHLELNSFLGIQPGQRWPTPTSRTDTTEQRMFSKDGSTSLCKLMTEEGSDKGNAHNYTTVYNYLLMWRTAKPTCVFELGIGTTDPKIYANMGANGKPGASLRAWAKFFPYGEIFGADIDERILFNTDQIKTFQCDQTDIDSINRLWSHSDMHSGFDLMIDDGYHHIDANIRFFEHSIHKLNHGGYYVIEDIHLASLVKFQHKVTEWQLQYPDLQFWFILRPSQTCKFNNNLLVVSRDYQRCD